MTETEGPTGAVEPLASWDAWWCKRCGNRYSVRYERCTCLADLTPVTVQLVARDPAAEPRFPGAPLINRPAAAVIADGPGHDG